MGARSNNVTRGSIRGSARESVAERVRMKDIEYYDKVVSASRGERGLRTASARSRVKLRVSGCLRGLGHAKRTRCYNCWPSVSFLFSHL